MEFSGYLHFGNGSVSVDEAGKAVLDDNCLWLQVLDHTGTEVTNYNKPPEIPDHYEPYQFLEAYQYGSGAYTVLLSTVEFEDGQYTYLLGFPMSLSKVTMYIDTARYNAGKVLIISVAALTAVSVVMLTIYSYKAFQASENRRRQDELAKEEWLANITHDLKTPLAPIRGYAELMTENGTHTAQDIRRYGQIILKNVMYTEQLVDDLKLTYQLQSNMLPICAQSGNIVRFVKELVIDILNSPEYEGREVDFTADSEDVRCAFDCQLLRRALTNIVINALKHNSADTKITVSLVSSPQLRITVADEGRGMTAEELEGLFKRYYRGTSTEVKAEGSGLGMAIARQIVEAHGGSISAGSTAGTGTTVTVCLPKN